jgi:hypothetical protein
MLILSDQRIFIYCSTIMISAQDRNAVIVHAQILTQAAYLIAKGGNELIWAQLPQRKALGCMRQLTQS